MFPYGGSQGKERKKENMENLFINRLYEKFTHKEIRKDGSEEFYFVSVPYADSKDGFASIIVKPSHIKPTKDIDGSEVNGKVNIWLGWPKIRKTISVCTDIDEDGAKTYEKITVTNQQILDGFLKARAEFQSSKKDVNENESQADSPEPEGEMSLQELIEKDNEERETGITDKKEILRIFKELSQCPLESAVTDKLLDYSIDYLKQGGYLRDFSNISDIRFGEFFDSYYREMVDYAISKTGDKENCSGSEEYPSCLLPRLDNLTINMFKFFECLKEKKPYSGPVKKFMNINYDSFLNIFKEEYGMDIGRVELHSEKEPGNEILEDVLLRINTLCLRVYIPELDFIKFRQETRMGYAILLLNFMNPLFVISDLVEKGEKQLKVSEREKVFLPADMSNFCKQLQNTYQQIV